MPGNEIIQKMYIRRHYDLMGVSVIMTKTYNKNDYYDSNNNKKKNEVNVKFYFGHRCKFQFRMTLVGDYYSPIYFF